MPNTRRADKIHYTIHKLQDYAEFHYGGNMRAVATDLARIEAGWRWERMTDRTKLRKERTWSSCISRWASGKRSVTVKKQQIIMRLLELSEQEVVQGELAMRQAVLEANTKEEPNGLPNNHRSDQCSQSSAASNSLA
jgi:hypothetical protein